MGFHLAGDGGGPGHADARGWRALTPRPLPLASTFWNRVRTFRARHQQAEIAVFFSAGFLFDILTLDRIDSPFSIAQQTLYLSVLGGLLLYEQRHELRLAKPGKILAWAARFSEDLIHFLLGSLLSAFSLLYFQSASGVVALLFMAAVFALLVANELPRFRRLGHLVRVALYAFCVISFFSYLLPTAVGFLSAWLFLLAVGLSMGLGFLLFWLVRSWSKDSRFAARRVLLPFAAVSAAVLGLYLLRVVPPIPLYARSMGIYHEVRRQGGQYRLFHQRPGWKLWQTGDQTFRARPGDRAYLFVSIWAPRGFRDLVKVRWSREEPGRGFVDHKPYPLSFQGGREQGFRTFAYTSDPHPGRWRVFVETDDGRVIGTLGFTVVEDPSTEQRNYLEDEG